MKYHNDPEQEVIELHYHRNGVSGLGFHVGIVRETDDDDTRNMLVIRFHKEADDATGNVVCAAFDLAKLAQHEIRFIHNSWRGDHYSDVMDEAIEESHRQRDEEWEAEQRIAQLEKRVPL